jgi:hypothetical protein
LLFIANLLDLGLSPPLFTRPHGQVLGFPAILAQKTKENIDNPIRVIGYCSDWVLLIRENRTLIEKAQGL